MIDATDDDRLFAVLGALTARDERWWRREPDGVVRVLRSGTVVERYVTSDRRGVAGYWTLGHRVGWAIESVQEGVEVLATRGLLDESWLDGEASRRRFRCATCLGAAKFFSALSNGYVACDFCRGDPAPARWPASRWELASLALPAPGALLAAEALGREVAARLGPWGLGPWGFGRAPDAPVVWRVGRRTGGARTWLAAIEAALLDVGSTANLPTQRCSDEALAARWERLAKRGKRLASGRRGERWTDRPNAYEPLVALSRTPFELDAVEPERIVLVCPAVGDRVLTPRKTEEEACPKTESESGSATLSRAATP